ncbi:hypothetical protein THAR02_03447 [Trichoderma harzianum]|uniref:Aflatoxin regulatory protein domain-containing protein n=1 Tax=Trichoderma harzianum TaxID=5544 RepID=A0A0F9XIW5_TRIHA|nr:hypothetical protein THAR02_03447 [Trichoderma harzianum]
MFTNCDGCFEPPPLSQDFIANGPFNNDMAAGHYKSIFSAFEEDGGSMSAGSVDAGSEMDRLGFFPSSTASERYQQPFRDIASLLMPIKDTTVFTPISESMSIPDTLSCSCCSSTGRSKTSPARFPSTGSSTASLANMSTGKTSPTDILETLACQCLDQALQLLKTVSGSSRSTSAVSSLHSDYLSQPSQGVSRTSSTSTTSDGDDSSKGFCKTGTQPQWLQATLSENRQCLGAMDNILACSSSDKDSMLPEILCMILLKILDRYSNMVWCRPLLPHSANHRVAELGSNMSGYLIVATGLEASAIHRQTFMSNEQGQMQPIHFDCGTSRLSDDEYFGRATAHLVLGELQWVQKVVNKLVAKLKYTDCYNAGRPTQQSNGWESRKQTVPLPMEEPAEPGLTSSFSVGTLEHMATDIQKRLTTLSSCIINQLR